MAKLNVQQPTVFSVTRSFRNKFWYVQSFRIILFLTLCWIENSKLLIWTGNRLNTLPSTLINLMHSLLKKTFSLSTTKKLLISWQSLISYLLSRQRSSLTNAAWLYHLLRELIENLDHVGRSGESILWKKAIADSALRWMKGFKPPNTLMCWVQYKTFTTVKRSLQQQIYSKGTTQQQCMS